MTGADHPKIQPAHRQRQAYVYIRQSSLKQVTQHLESQDLQYQLARHAHTLGWPEDQVVVIDDDLGKSGADASKRSGFQALVAAVGLHQVGIILVTDVSRLARNCADWYQLLDLASYCGTLISDAGGIYEPRHFDDRLLLGMKGTFAEAQWFTMRGQLHAAKLNKARRGELVMPLPVGLDRAPNGLIVLTPDADIQSALRLVFSQFALSSSARDVLRFFHERALLLPRPSGPGPVRQLVWVKPTYQAIYHLLKHPAYAGAYTYGKHASVRIPGATRKVASRQVPLEQWPVLIRDAFPAFISWDQFLDNQNKLRLNRQHTAWSGGVPRPGSALLAGIVVCARCGAPIHPHYTHSPAYVCDHANRNFAKKRCQRFGLAPVDAAVTDAILDAIQGAHLDAAIAAISLIESQQRALATHWLLRIDRANYDADLARRRYEAVDPALRLVAAELERLWEDKLRSARALQQEWTRLQSTACAPLDAAELLRIRSLAQDVPALWNHAATTPADRKRLIRCLIRLVALDARPQPEPSLIHIHWHTGATTTLAVSRPKSGGSPAPPALIVRIRDLAQRLTDDQIAERLNADGIPTARDNHTWSLLRVRHFRNKHHIPTACPYVSKLPGPRADGLRSAREAACLLHTNFGMIADWFRRGLLVGHQHAPGTPLWVRLADDDLRRLSGAAPITGDMLPLLTALSRLNLDPDVLRTAIASGELFSYRFSVGKTWRWFISAPAQSPFRNLLIQSGAS